MNKRRKKKTQRELGYVSIGAWVRPELQARLLAYAEQRRISQTSIIEQALEAFLNGGE